MLNQYDKLKSILREMFQMDQSDLDFGIYRIMNAKREEIESFLDKELLPQVTTEFAKYRGTEIEEKKKELNALEATLRESWKRWRKNMMHSSRLFLTQSVN